MKTLNKEREREGLTGSRRRYGMVGRERCVPYD